MITLAKEQMAVLLLIAPSRQWYLFAWFFMGLGVITKGVGFLPMFSLLVAGCCSLEQIKKWFNKVLSSMSWLLATVLIVGVFLCLFKLPAITRQLGDTTWPLALLCLLAAIVWIGVIYKGCPKPKKVQRYVQVMKKIDQ